ncbi:MAG: glutamyl-tRNA reductase [Candidatus Nanopelagicales bacterium]|jgi:glutamyl-tRNA reductase|nr:glutamyl-tRNA reductase [Candidatus Nanopelagicales bacterium]
MTLLVLGVSHRSAPLAVLDRLALTQDAADRLAADATAHDAIAEAIVVTTCNRVEVYADVARFHPAVTELGDLLVKATGAQRATLLEHSYLHFDSAAVAHLFAVAAGLDSMVVGEAQILGQVRAALVRGQDHGTAGRALNRVVQRALRAGKRVHTETGIDRSGQSVVSVALDSAAAHVGDLARRRVLVVGAGSMGSLAASLLAGRGGCDLVVANRTRSAGEHIAAGVPGGRAVGLADLPAELAQADVAVFCTGAQDLVLDADALTRARGGRRDPLVVLDLALPHDTDPAIAELPGVTRVDLAWLARHPAAAASEADVAEARRLVADEVAAHLADLAGQQVEPTLVSLRAHAGSVIDDEMARLRLRLASADDATMAEVERGMRRAFARLLHNPTVRMKQLAAEPGGDRYAAALSALFDLDPALPASVLDPTADLDPQQGPR